MEKYCADCEEAFSSPSFVRCPNCGLLLTARPLPSATPAPTATNGRSQTLSQNLLSLADILGEGLRDEIQSFIDAHNGSLALQPISDTYLNSIGKVTLDRRRSLLQDVRLSLDFKPSSSSSEGSTAISIVAVMASFGPLPAKSSLSAEAVLPSDAIGETFSSADQVNEKIVVLKRGAISFLQKAQRAHAAGAVALIVLQSYEIWPFVMTHTSAGNEAEADVEAGITIPVLMVSLKASDLLLKIFEERNSLSIPLTIRFHELASECAICQEEMKEGEVVIKLPECGHAYHESCVLSWLQSQHTCPLCRQSMPKKAGGGEGSSSSSSAPSSQLTGHMSTYYN